VAALLCLAAPLLVRPSNAAEPITIGFAEALTGNLGAGRQRQRRLARSAGEADLLR
jgi:hypothetical protein